jgi:hypothetical protein
VSGRRISLALTLHNHQPIGNFGWVFADVFEQAYQPMVEALERHPGIRVGLHYTGSLLEWLRAERPAFIETVRTLVERGQVEILGGGLYEPVLVALPERDRIEQLRRMADVVEAAFGRRPRGAWLAERVWEPDLPTSLVAGGYDWTILDDAHFRAAAVPEDALWGPYTTEDQARLLTVFGTEQGLRYRIPFHEVDEVIAYLREHATEAGDRVGTMGDDGEKFGAWPTTWEHCWGKGRWVERFFEAVEASSDWLTTVRPSDWLERNAPIGRVYLPTGSYAEMGEWALPAEESRAFSAALRHARETDAPEARWLRGASWRNFQVKYREVNDLHKQMLQVSAKVDAMPPGRERDAALDHLFRGQSNDCYWHGLFGGIYIAHMRAATLAHLIAAEDLADPAIGSATRATVTDLDLDGRDELLLSNEAQRVAIKLDEGAGIGAWDLRAARHALTGVLRRRPEAYHAALLEDAASAASGPRDAGHGDKGHGDGGHGAASIHEQIRVKETGLAKHLVYDEFERRSGLIRILPFDATPETWGAGGRGDIGDAATGPFRLVRPDPDETVLAHDGSATMAWGEVPVSIETRIRLGGGRLDPRLEWSTTIENRGSTPFLARVGVEWAITMLGGGGNPHAYWGLAGLRTSHDATVAVGRLGASGDVDRIVQGNRWLGVEVETLVGPACDAWYAPIETISNSEAGFERVYQGSALLLSLPIRLEPGELFTMTTQHRVTIATDRLAEETAS